MTIRVVLMGVIAAVAGEKELVLPGDLGVTLREVLDRLETRYGEEFARRVFRSQMPPRPLQMHTRIFVNGTLVGDDTLDRPLPGDGAGSASPEVLIYLLPAATGG